jgi:hypothetical protein
VSRACATVDQWKERNAHRLIDCRWGCRITPEACHAYQARAGRYILHFNGDSEPYQRANAEYVTCLLPEPCPNVVPDHDIRTLGKNRSENGLLADRERRLAARRLRQRQQLADPNVMLEEEDWRRSLVSR